MKKRAKQVKKQNLFEKHYIAVIFLIVLIVLFVVGLAIYLKYTPKYWCRVNSDKCVCEDKWASCLDDICDINTSVGTFYYITQGVSIQLSNFDTFSGNVKIECKKFRKKTPSELSIDDCNNNPREDNKCKCLEQKDSDKITGGKACEGSCKPITINRCTIKGIYSFSRQKIITGNYDDYLNSCIITPKYDSSPITQITNFSIQIFEENITQCEQCYTYEQKCVKSRPKTEQEKYQEDYVTETNCKNITKIANMTQVPLSNCNLKSEWLVDCVNITEVNETTCETTSRLKNECEKGNPNWGEEDTGYITDKNKICIQKCIDDPATNSYFDVKTKTYLKQSEPYQKCLETCPKETICRQKTKEVK